MRSAKKRAGTDLGRGMDKGSACKWRAGRWTTLSRWGLGIALGLVMTVAGIGLVGCGEDQTEKKQQASTDSVPLPSQEEAKPPLSFDPDTVLAEVNGEEISVQELQELLSSLPDSEQKTYAKSKHELLEAVIIRTALLQEAKRLKIRPEAGEATLEQGAPADEGGDDDVINALFEQEVLNNVAVQEADVRRFYEQNKGQMPTETTFDEIRERLRPYVLQMKRQEAINTYIDDLLQQADINKNEDWIAAQKAKSAENPLAKALETGRPVLADFGRGSCMPCKMMEPILEELQEEYKGRAEILVLDVGEYPVLTRRYSIQTIPTQIFFDASGEEVKRHEGFMSKEDIVAVLQELKVAAN